MADIITIAAFGGGFGTCLLGFYLRHRRNPRRDPVRPSPYSSHPQGLPPPPPGPGMARWFINRPKVIRQCGGPCTNGAVFCDCGALWIDVYEVHPWSEGRTIRGNGHGGPTTPKPEILPRGTNPLPPGAKLEPPLGRVVDASGRAIGTIRMGTPVYIDAHGQCRLHPSFRPPGTALPSPPPSEP